jgi:hypothetical protein
MKKTYRIYSRISREILDKNKAYFYQFDLYAGQQIEQWVIFYSSPNLLVHHQILMMHHQILRFEK